MKIKAAIVLLLLSHLAFSQSIEFNGLKVNGEIPASLSLNDLENYKVKTDSIRPMPELMDMSFADSLVYIGGTYFEYFKETNKCVLSVIKFDRKITSVSFGDLVLNAQTSIETIQSKFPNDCSIINEAKINKEKDVYQSCSLPIVNGGKPTDAGLIFFFQKGKLSRIDLWNSN